METLVFAGVSVAKIAVVMVTVLLTVAVLTLAERKVLSWMQDRMGPMEVGPHGALQTVADMLKLLSKQLVTPLASDHFTFLFAPILIFIPTVCLASLVPLGGASAFAEMPNGLAVVVVLSGITVIAIFMAGWSSNNKYAVLGGMRSVAQVVAYEIPVLLSALSVVLIAQSLNLHQIAAGQTVPYVLVEPVAALIFFIGITAETNRAPFDIPEAESELVGGFHTEYAGMRFALFFFAEYTNMLVLGAVGATLFLGGWKGPFVAAAPWLGPIYLLLKSYVVVFLMMWARWTFPRLRFDQLMNFAWKLLIPVALVNLVVTAGVLFAVGAP